MSEISPVIFLNTLFIKVFCSDCNQITLDVITHRGLNPHNCDVHIGLDGGQGMLKVALTITDRLDVEKQGRATYTEVFKYFQNLANIKIILLKGMSPKQAKNSSVKKLLLLAVVPDAPENYFNVKAILTQLDIEVLEFTVSADLKMRNEFFLLK